MLSKSGDSNEKKEIERTSKDKLTANWIYLNSISQLTDDAVQACLFYSPDNVSQGGLLSYIQFFPHKVIYGHRTTETLHASQVTQKSIFVRRKLVIRNYYIIAAYTHAQLLFD